MGELDWLISNSSSVTGWVIALAFIGLLLAERIVPRGRLKDSQELVSLLRVDNEKWREAFEKLAPAMQATADQQRETNRTLDDMADTLKMRSTRKA